MIPLNKDTVIMASIAVCLIGVLYLYREMMKLKKVSTVKTHGPVPVLRQDWVPTPVNDARAPVPPAVTPVPPPITPVPPPPPIPVSTEDKQDKSG